MSSSYHLTLFPLPGRLRSVQIAASRPEPRLAVSIPSPKGRESDGIIDKASFFGKSSGDDDATSGPSPIGDDKLSVWIPTKLRPVPAFYPLEKSSRLVDDDLSNVTTRISECLRLLSVQAIYNNETATAALMTGENVEMHLSLWKTSGGKFPEGIVVELQRRKGCSITFHRYSRHILDAAMGDFDFEKYSNKAGEGIERAYSRMVERLLSRDSGKTPESEYENAIIAVEIAHGLLMKDRMDARQLGLESLCLLTDPQKTGVTTAVIASRVVLLGTAQIADRDEGMLYDEAPFHEVRETILSLVQLRRIGDEEEFSEDDNDSDRHLNDTLSDEMEGHPEEKEHMSILHNLALAVMANALNVIENYDEYDTNPEETDKKVAAHGATSSSTIANSFMKGAKDITKLEILSTLIAELGKAENNPHNACLSAKCLHSLFRASKDARRRARELGAKNIINTALDVGVRTHAKLETECKNVVKVLTETVNDDEE